MIPGIVAAGLAVTGDFEEPVADATFADVVFLGSWNGADNAVVAGDDSLSAHTITFHGNAKLNTSVKQFGTASLELDGVGDYTSVASHSDFHFGTGPFCIEGFVRPDTSVFQDSTIVGMWTLDALVDQRGWRVSYTNEGLQFQYSANGDTVVTILSAPSTIDLNTQHHFCVQRNSNALMQMFVDGVEVDSATSAANLWPSTLDLTIGANFDTVVAADLSGHIDEVRITRNWWYDGDFTVPVAEYDRPGPIATGTLAATEGADTAAFAGPLVHEGTLAATEGTDLAAIVGHITWAPSDDADLFIWYKGGDLTGANGSTVTTWPDASGNARDATSGSATLDTTGLNSINVVNAASASSQRLTIPNVLTGLTEAAVYAVVKANADPAASSASSGGFLWTSSANHGTGGSHHPFTDGVVYDGFGSTVRKTCGNPTPSLASWAIISFHTLAANYQCYVNGTLLFSTATNTIGWTTTPNLFQGASAAYYNGKMAELFLLDDFGDTTSRQKAEGYLAHRFAITSVLDAGHPYKTTPPPIV